MHAIADSSATPPLHLQIARLLLRDIMAGRLVAGQKLPPERDMAAEMGIAVGTLRKALGQLTEQGVLERIQGSGNYVKSDPQVTGVYSFFRLELCGGGGVPSARILSLDRLPGPPDLPSQSGVSHRIRRLRFLDQHPAAIEEIWLSGDWAETLPIAGIGPSLYHHYKTQLGLWITAAEDRVSVDRAPDWSDAACLPPGAPCGHVRRHARAQNGRIAEISQTWFDPDRVVYVQRLT